MSRKIKNVAVLGSGIMGTGIACHFANIGLDVIMLDMPTDGPKRNARADGSLKMAIKGKPASLYQKSFASRITTGNFEDDLDKIATADWIIEVIIERADIKKSLFEKVEKFRKPGSLITSNTSGIPIGVLAEGRSKDFKDNFCGTHFFNPARYMALLEIIPHEGTSSDVVDFFMHYGDIFLGKKTVLCKDTPAFIGNRIGFYSGNKVNELTEKYDLNISEVDKLTGAAIEWPNTGSYRLLDLVGLDTSVKVTQGVVGSCPDDEYAKIVKERGTPKYLQFLLDNKFLGKKSGQGFYKKTGKRDENGKSIIHELNLDTLEYQPTQRPTSAALKIGKKVEIMDKRIKDMIAVDDSGGKFLSEFFGGLIAYSANRVPEISDDFYSLDDAMKAGYAWGYGPFEYWDMIGFEAGIKLAESHGETLPDWVHRIQDKANHTFYKSEDGSKKYYDIRSGSFEVIPGTANLIHLDDYRENHVVLKNSECQIHDIGDQVLCLEFTSKANSIGENIGIGLDSAIKMAEEGDWRGIVIGNNGKNFSVGANLMPVGMLAMQNDWESLEKLVAGFQDMNMKLRYSGIPIVTGTQGYVFGGGCEIAMHTDATVAAAESYIGLVEVGVGLIPGGGGTKEFALRASDSFFEGDTQIPTLLEKLKGIATASVSTSAYEAFEQGTLLENRDKVSVGTHHVLQKAKKQVINLSEGYTPPSKKQITVLGRGGLGALYTGINEFYLGKYMSAYDVEISRKVAYVLCGGDLTSQQKVSEQYLLDLEREAFLQLLGNQKTQERIQYMLMNSKPLRN